MYAYRNAARLLLRMLDNPQKLAENPLLAHLSAQSHEERRAVILRVLDNLNPGPLRGADPDRRRRRHAIIVRCDVNGESQELVARSLGLSMRQFFRERAEAFDEFIAALKTASIQTNVTDSLVDVFVARERLIQQFRATGQHDRVWTESTQIASELGYDERAIGLWVIAAEAARYMNDMAKSREAVHRAQQIREMLQLTRPIAADILIAIPSVAVDWTSGQYTKASDQVEEALRRHGYGRTLAGFEAALFGVLLTYGITIELERGKWERAQSLQRLLENVGERVDDRLIAHSIRRQAGSVALRSRRDAWRAIVELREAFAIAQRFDNLVEESSIATELGIALASHSPQDARRYIEYGLAVGRKLRGRNEYAMLALGALPTVCRLSGASAARMLLNELTDGVPLAKRARMAFDLAEVALLLQQHKYHAVIEAAGPLSEVLESHGLIQAAREALLMIIVAEAGRGRRAVAQRLLKRRSEFIRECGTICNWSATFGRNLAELRG